MPRPETRAERLAYRWSFLAVYAGTVASVAWLWVDAGPAAVAELGKLAAASFFLVGKFVVFAALHEDTLLGPWGLALMVWLVDLLVALALASGLEAFERAPVLGAWLRRARRRAVEVLKEYPRLERMAFLGVVLFVLLPIAATGAISGSFAARMLGLTRIAGILAIAVGSAGTAVTFASLASWIGERAEALLQSPVLTSTALVALAAFAYVAYERVKRLLRT